MPKSKSEIMRALREKRSKMGFVEVTIWIKKSKVAEALKLIKEYILEVPKKD